MKQESMLQAAQVVEKQYKDVLEYKRSMGFLTKWAEHERFYAGDQWPAPTERTKNLPRPVFNIVQRIVDHKVASVMSENIKMVFSAMDVEDGSPEAEGADKFTRYSETNWELIKQDQLNEDMLQSCGIGGTGLIHYYFDPNKTGGNKVKYQGHLCGEIIDVVNYFPGDPQQPDIQKQPYFIITSRELVSNVRKQAEENGVSRELALMITSDKESADQAYDMAKQEMTSDEKVIVLTKYWKENGNVYFMKVSSGIVCKPQTNTGLKVYPLAGMHWRKRKGSAFGVGEIEGLIPNQKSINFLIAMQIKSVQDSGWPKLLVRPGALKRNPTNTPGEILFDNSPSGEWGIKHLEPAPMSNMVNNLVSELMTYTKETVGANENALGEQVGSDLNAAAIMALQKASSVPIESIKRRFYQFVEDVGRIWEDMWKVYYNMERNVVVKDDEQQDVVIPFKGDTYKDVDMVLKIDIGPSSSYSESLMMASLDKLFDGQYISLEDYLEFAPKNVIPFKDRLLKKVQQQMEMQREQAIQQATQQVMAEEQMQQAPEETDLNMDVQMLYEQAPDELKMQIDQMVQQGMSNRQIIETLATMM
ncbi:hypothetical protein [Ectobacillus antri]|uniref:portal protein n=1 Tax=Ectobacillus antri TaxID=2486280 RepID=UPI000F59F579|nr:hypothetical protein [Ectobacillus antri]